MNMRTATILALVFFAMRAASQDVAQSPTRAQCTFSDGTSIAVTYSLGHQRYRLSTDGPLLTTQGISVPAGDYTAYLEKDSHQHWTLKMVKPFDGKGLFILSPPLSVTTSAPPIEDSEVSFDHTGGSCMMHWSQKKADTVLSLEFTEKNADMPVPQ
jgi:hypothetical protein